MSTRQDFRLCDFVLFDTGVEQKVKSADVKLSSAGSEDSMDLSRSAELSNRNMYFREFLCIIVVDLVVLNT